MTVPRWLYACQRRWRGPRKSAESACSRVASAKSVPMNQSIRRRGGNAVGLKAFIAGSGSYAVANQRLV